MADIVIRGVDIPKPNEGAYLMQVFNDGRTIVYRYAVSGQGFGTDSQKVIETKAVPLPEGHGRLIDADAFKAMCLSATKEAKPDFIRREDWLKSCAVTMSFCRDIDEQPTIVPAEGGGEDG